MNKEIPPEEGGGALRGFIVHAYAEPRGDRLFLLGRLEDGRSFAAVESRWRPCLHIREEDRDAVAALLRAMEYRIRPAALESFSVKKPVRRD